MKPAHPSVMTPQPLSCVMHHILLPSSSEHGCHHASSQAPPEASHQLQGYMAGGRRRGEGALLDASSTSQTPEGVILIYICWGHILAPPPPLPPPPPLRDWFITEQKGDSGIRRCESSFAWVRSHDTLLMRYFLFDIRSCASYTCIKYIKFMERIIIILFNQSIWEQFGLYLNRLWNV